jgi:hypothetical protein
MATRRKIRIQGSNQLQGLDLGQEHTGVPRGTSSRTDHKVPSSAEGTTQRDSSSLKRKREALKRART